MSMEAEVKVFVQKDQKKVFENPPKKRDLREVLKGRMIVGFHIPSEFTDELKALITENQNKLIDRPLWLAVLLFDREALLRPEPLVIKDQEDLIHQLVWNAAYMIRFREAVDGATLFNIQVPKLHKIR